MARSVDETPLAYWQHKTGVASSPAMQRAIQKHGATAAGVYLMTADLIAQEPTHRLPWGRQEDCDALAWMLHISTDDCAMIIATLKNVGLLKVSTAITCPEIDATVALVNAKSERARKAIAARWEKDKPSTSGNDT